MIRRTSWGRVSTSMPPTSHRPPSGRRSVVSIRRVVVLPAPFGPSSPNTVPSGTARSRLSTARTGPYDFMSPSAMIAFAMRPNLSATSDTLRPFSPEA